MPFLLYTIMKKPVYLLLSFLALLLCVQASAKSGKTQALDYGGKSLTLFDGTKAQYRIPAIVETKSGKLLAFTDHRFGGGDVGWGNIDIVLKASRDGGRHWGDETMVARGESKDSLAFDRAHGDAAAVVDRETGDILVMAASGGMSFWSSTRKNPLRMGRFISHDEGKTWSGEDVTEAVYGLMPGIQQAFFTSGTVYQSSRIKAGSHYRIYSVVVTRQGNRVMYSDDFGMQWHVLGSASNFAEAAPKGDEAKVVELPDGNVLLSSRVTGGRYFNIYYYDDASKATGHWGRAAYSGKDCNGIVAEQNACNGELVLVHATQGKQKVTLLLQSIPLGPKRTNVGIYYKRLASPADYATPEAIARNWEGVYQVSHTTSAYSAMMQSSDGRIRFLFEENNRENHYDITFRTLTIKEITGGKYK